MATKPSTLPLWATDTNLASGTQSGSSTKLEPSLGYKQQGCVPGKSAPGRYMNWLFNLLYSWIVYLDDLHNSAEFLNKSYTWLTGVHRFTNGLRAAGVGLESGEVTYTDAAGAASPKLRTITVPWVSGLGAQEFSSGTAPDGNFGGAGAGTLDITRNGSFVTSGGATFAIVLPQGAVLKSWNVLCRTNGQSFNFSFTLRKVTHDFITPAAGTPSTVGSGQTQSGAPSTTYVKGQSSLSETIGGAGTQYWIEAAITSSPTPPTEYTLTIYSVYLQYEESRGSGSH